MRVCSHAAVVTVALAWTLAPGIASPLGAQADATRAARMSVVGMDVTSADIVAWCDAGGAGAAVRPAYAAWRTRHAVDEVTGRLDAEAREQTRAGMGKVMAATREKLSAMGQPAAVCPQLASMWTSESFNARGKFAAAYATTSDGAAGAPETAVASHAPAVGGSPGAAPRPAKAFNPEYYAATTRPTGTVYSPSQFRPWVQSWWGTPRNYERAKAMLARVGTVYVRGKVTRRRESLFLEDNDGTFASDMLISPSVDLAAFEGQQITVQGTIDELPGYMTFLRQTRVVRDPSALVASTIAPDAGRHRIEVDVARITAPAGRGLRPADIHGVLHHGYGATGASGYEYREEVRLLLKDGWVYYRNEVAPLDLDVAASRRLEPQQWGHWRSGAGGIEVQQQDDYGRPAEAWHRQEGRLLPTWPAETRLSGSYNAASFNGSVYLGGTYSSTSYVFRPDGRYERIGFSRSSSAAMAAQGPQEFSASASSVSSGSGTQSSAGGGQPGVYVGTRSGTDDGARNRGTYRLDGTMIELRNDAGEVTRALCVPTGADRRSIYMFGRSFSIKDK